MSGPILEGAMMEMRPMGDDRDLTFIRRSKVAALSSGEALGIPSFKMKCLGLTELAARMAPSVKASM